MLQSSDRKVRLQVARWGFTLIELVVVLLIIATIAGLVIPQVAMLTRSSDMAASAKTQADLASNIQLYFALQKRFPQGLDSLLINGTTPTLYTAVASDGTTAITSATVNDQATGLPFAGADGSRLQADLTPEALTTVSGGADFLRSFTRAGFDWVYDHDRAVVNSNNSAITQRLLTAAPVNVAKVTSASVLAKKMSPATAGVIDETKYKLIALGIGPNNDMISKTLSNCPTYPGCDGKYYGRYVAIFKVYATGERATLVAVVDSYGRAPDYTQQQFNESLPDGGRQG